ncbi:MAG: EF-Tu/IF-2/RF-3 family GTPase [Coprobacillaceae bacterium]
MGLLDIFKKKETPFEKEQKQYQNTTFNSNEFEMKIEDVFSITGRGTVVTGKVTKGTVIVGDVIKIKRTGKEELTVQVKGIEAFRKLLNSAEVGDNIGVLIAAKKASELTRGDILYK